MKYSMNRISNKARQRFKDLQQQRQDCIVFSEKRKAKKMRESERKIERRTERIKLVLNN